MMLKGRIPIIHMLVLLVMVYVVCDLMIYEELEGDMPSGVGGFKRIVLKFKALHRKLARMIRKDLMSVVFLRRSLDKSCHPALGCLLPKPSLLRIGALPELEGTRSAPTTVEPFTADLDAKVRESKRPAPDRVDAEPEVVIPAHADEAAEKSQVVGEAMATAPTPSRKDARGGSPAESDRAAKNPPYKLSRRIQKEMHNRKRIEDLLETKIDLVLNRVLLDMRGSISCGGKPVMEFRDMEAVLDAHPQLPDVIPEEDELGSRKLGKCAIVGNSGSLLGGGHGAEIDTHDAVIRFNAAPTLGYEGDVGTKTTVRIQNVDNLGFHESGDAFLVFTARNRRDLAKFVNHRKKYRKRKQYTFNPEFWCHLWDWVSHRKLKPSTGIAGIVLALRSCAHPINLYGFSHNATEFHYFNHLADKVTDTDVYKYHPLLEEAEVYLELASEGIANIVS